MKTIKKKFLLSIFVFFPLVYAYTQERTIIGVVREHSTRLPLPNIIVKIKSSNSSTVTNLKGEYKLNIPDTIKTIEFETFAGKKIIEIKKPQSNRYDIYLDDYTAQDILSLSFEELLNFKVITASKTEETRNEAPAIISVVSSKDIELYASKTLGDILDRVVGTFIYGSFYLPNNMITIRGEVTPHYCTHVLLLLNGRPMRSSKEGYYVPVIRSFPVENIDRLEIIRGPGSALYGSGAYSGIINIITKRGDKQSPTISFDYGSFGTSRAQIAYGFQKKEIDISLAGYYQNSQGWDYKVRGAFQDSLYPQTNTPAIENSKAITVSVDYKNLTFNTYYGTNYQMIGQQSQLWWYTDEWYLGTRKAMTNLGYTFNSGSKLLSNLNITYNHLKYWQPYDIHANDDRERGIANDIIFESTNIYKPTQNLSLTFGALTNTQTGYIKNTELLSNGTPYNVWIQPKNPDPFLVVPKYIETWWSLYTNLSYKPFKYLSLIAGAHANKVKNLKLDIVPRIGAILNLNKPITIKMLYGQAFRSPDFFELYSKVNGIYGNEFLKPEKITTYESQLSYNHKNFDLSITYFNNSQKDVIGRSLTEDSLLIVEGISQPMFINSEGLKSEGIEAEGKIKLVNQLIIPFSAFYHKNEDLLGNKNIYGLPNIFLKIGAQYYFKRNLNLGIFNMWVSKGNEFEVQFPNANPKAKAFDYLTAKLSLDLTEFLNDSQPYKLIFELVGYNLLNEKIYYPEYGYKNVNSIPGRSGISIHAAIKLKL